MTLSYSYNPVWHNQSIPRMISKSIIGRGIKSTGRSLSSTLIGQARKTILTSKVSLIGVATSKGYSKLLGANLNLLENFGEINECVAPRSIKTCASKEWTRRIADTTALDAYVS